MDYINVKTYNMPSLSIQLKNNILIEEYKAKWEYVRHTESLQAKRIQWYYAIVGGVLAYLYGKDFQTIAGMVEGAWVPLAVMMIYSILTNVKLLLQKKNYETYTARLRFIEGQEPTKPAIHQKVLSVFKVQYYSVVLIGAVLTGLLFQELIQLNTFSLLAAFGYFVAMLSVSFLPRF